MPRINVHFCGHVQGVGFRYTTHALAGDFAVTGFVRNLSDGRVHLVAEGTPSEMEAFLQAVQLRMADFIRETTVDHMASSGEFHRFEIRT